MSRFEVDSAQVQAASAKVAASTTAIRSEVAAMMRHLTELQGTWQGSAAQAFSGVMTDWSRTQRRVEESLDQVTRALQNAAKSYAEAEQHAARLFAPGR